MQSMHVFRQHKRLIGLLACLVILAGALAPGISHALSGSNKTQHALFIQLCSLSSNVSIAVPFERETDADPQPSAMQHCPYCLTQADSMTLLPGTHDLPSPHGLSFALLRLLYHAPSPLFAWAAAKPRGPPLLP